MYTCNADLYEDCDIEDHDRSGSEPEHVDQRKTRLRRVEWLARNGDPAVKVTPADHPEWHSTVGESLNSTVSDMTQTQSQTQILEVDDCVFPLPDQYKPSPRELDDVLQPTCHTSTDTKAISETPLVTTDSSTYT